MRGETDFCYLPSTYSGLNVYSSSWLTVAKQAIEGHQTSLSHQLERDLAKASFCLTFAIFHQFPF